MNRTVGVILARLGSRRLPRKALADVCGRPLISYVIDCARRVSSFAEIILATSTSPVDDSLATYAATEGLRVFRGSEDDVVARCLACVEAVNADFFVRLNGDSPFLDAALIDEGIAIANEGHAIDLVTNLIGRTFPYGISVEVISVPTLRRLARDLDRHESEHVTARFYSHPAQFNIRQITSPFPELASARIVVDTMQDLEAIRRVAGRLKSRSTWATYQEVASAYFSVAGADRPGTHTSNIGLQSA